MKFEIAIEYLRDGHRIYREKNPDEYLEGNLNQVFGSYYLTIYDVLAEDWQVVRFENNQKEKI